MNIGQGMQVDPQQLDKALKEGAIVYLPWQVIDRNSPEKEEK